MAYMFNGATQLLEVYIEDISNVTAMNCMFKTCRDIDTITMKGNPSKLNVVTDMFKDTTTVGTFYYDDRYDYSKIIAELPSTWTAVPITV